MNTPNPAAVLAKKVNPDLARAKRPEVTNAELRELVNSENLDAAEIAFERLKSRSFDY